jgi:hypothetical protein
MLKAFVELNLVMIRLHKSLLRMLKNEEKRRID